MNKNTYHFEHLRLNVAPQTRVSSQNNTHGFISLAECIKFCDSIGFSYYIYYYDMDGKKHLKHEQK